MTKLINEISYRLRASLIDELSPITFNGVEVPIMDQKVNPSVLIPIISGGKAYVIINSQTSTETSNDKCSGRVDANISFDIVTKFPKGLGGAINSEMIAEIIMQKVNRNLSVDDFQLMNCTMNFNQNLNEESTSETVFRKLVSFNFDAYQQEN